MVVHIGKIIQKLVKESGMSVTRFADEVYYSRRNIYEIFDKKTIDTGLLIKISKVLKQNLFLNYISEADIVDFKNAKSTNEELTDILAGLKSEVQKLKDNNVIVNNNNNISINKKTKKK